MGKELAIEWLKSAFTDIENINYIKNIDYLTNVVSYHSQQAIEKSFKAILEFYDKEVPKTHSLIRLHNLVKDKFPSIDYKILDDLDSLYIDSRYPGDLGLLPYGKPTLEHSKNFYKFAKEVFKKACNIIGIDELEIIQIVRGK